MKHVEEKDVILLNRSGIEVDAFQRTVVIPTNYQNTKPIGIKRWGRIDFLVNHCGYVIVRNAQSIVRLNSIDQTSKNLAKIKAKDSNKEYSKKKNRTMMNS